MISSSRLLKIREEKEHRGGLTTVRRESLIETDGRRQIAISCDEAS
jgi:hypothetical protein